MKKQSSFRGGSVLQERGESSMRELKRDIYQELVAWKERHSGKVLELEGARQVGKTYILSKFAEENYKTFLYINMAQTTGKEFLACLDTAMEWKPGLEREKHPIHKALQLFEKNFKDCKLFARR